MKYDFTSIIDRHGKDAIAVDRDFLWHCLKKDLILFPCG